MKTRRVFTFALALLLLPSIMFTACAATIMTTSYRITVTEHCNEDIACQDVSFAAKRLSDGQQIQLNGRAVVSLCSDGVTPCHHQGFRFDDGDTSYFVSDNDWLEISRDGKVILHEEFLSYEHD